MVFSLTVSSPWPITLLHSADPASATGSDRSSSHWRQPLQRHLCMLLLAFDWTAATVYLLVSVVNYYRSCKWSRTPPLVSSQEPKDRKAYDTRSTRSSLVTSSTAHHILDGSSCLQVSAQHSPMHSTFRCTVSRRQHSPLGIFDLLTLLDWLFHVREQTTATIASLFKDLGSGTVFLLNCEHRTFRWTCSETNWRHFFTIRNCWHSAFAALCDLALYKCNNNNNNNNNNNTYLYYFQWPWVTPNSDFTWHRVLRGISATAALLVLVRLCVRLSWLSVSF